MRLSGSPQPPQNRAPAGFSVPQLGQTLIGKSVVRGDPRYQAPAGGVRAL